MTKYVEITVNVPQVSGVFHYHVPHELEKLITPGQLVRVPFGKQTVQGVVMGFVGSPEVPQTKPVIDLVDPNAVLTENQLILARKLSEQTLASLAACIEIMLPTGIAQQADTLYTPITKQYSGNLNETQRRILMLLNKRGPLLGRQVERSLGRMNWKPAAQSLKRMGLLQTESLLPSPKVHPKSIRTAQLAVTPVIAEKSFNKLGRHTRTIQFIASIQKVEEVLLRLREEESVLFNRRRQLIAYLQTNPGDIPISEVIKQTGCTQADITWLVKLNIGRFGETPSPATKRRQAMLRFLIKEPEPVDVSWLYAESGGNLTDLYHLVELGLVVLGESEIWRDPVENLNIINYSPPQLTQDQNQVWLEVQRTLADAIRGKATEPMLVHGVTGSGKTEIYLHAVQETLELGKQAIVLVPEIALTPQTIRRFAGRFPGVVGLLHSGLSDGERYDTWRRARSGEISIIVGPRSALFTPFNRLGLIVIDECHDDTYYQADTEPYYHAREAAILYAEVCGAACLLGTATPDIVTYFRATEGIRTTTKKILYKYLHLPGRILAHHDAIESQLSRLRDITPDPNRVKTTYLPLEGKADSTALPPVKIVDMREELKAGNRSIFSRDLHASILDILDTNQQAILFLNRRGTATYVFCRDCGQSLMCPRCEIPLILHQPQNRLICHHCNYQRKNPEKCPSCHSHRIRHYGTGTERVEAEVQKQFPGARTLRWDFETTRTKGAHDLILSHFSSHRADILIGTQMIAKGLDLPLVTLVGVILADVGLNMPDYRSAERTFQVLTQVSGRAGRSPLGGSVILQTFQPENYVIQTAAQHDYLSFFNAEIANRKKFSYPPYSNLVKLEFRDQNNEVAETTSLQMAESIRNWIAQEGRRATRIIGPAPCFFSKVKGYYRWQIVVAGPDPVSLLRGRQLGKWKVSVNPPNLL